MIQEFHKGVEIELEIHQLPQDLWSCDRTCDPSRRWEFPTMDLAKENALQEARDTIDRNSEGKPEKEMANPRREVRIMPYPE